MTRKRVKKKILNQLKYLRKRRIEDLMKEKRIPELEDIGKKLDFSDVEAFVNRRRKVKLNLHDIGSLYWYETIFYINRSGIEDEKILKDCRKAREFINALLKFEFNVPAKPIELKDYTLQELVGQK